MASEWKDVDHALEYLARADTIPHRTEGEAALLEEVPPESRRILDLGMGDGRLLELLLLRCPEAEAIGVDFSPPMISPFTLLGNMQPSVFIWKTSSCQNAVGKLTSETWHCVRYRRNPAIVSMASSVRRGLPTPMISIGTRR